MAFNTEVAGAGIVELMRLVTAFAGARESTEPNSVFIHGGNRASQYAFAQSRMQDLRRFGHLLSERHLPKHSTGPKIG